MIRKADKFNTTINSYFVIVLRAFIGFLIRKIHQLVNIGDRKDGVCLELHGQVSWQPKRCRSAMLVFQVFSSTFAEIDFDFGIEIISPLAMYVMDWMEISKRTGN